MLEWLLAEPSIQARLGFEITETAINGETADPRAWMETLHPLGCTFALDNFGTRSSSLSFAREFPIGQIKIDGSFIAAMERDARALAVVQSVVALADGLQVTTVAEAIETEKTASRCRELGLALGQGYLFGEPAPLRTLDGRDAS